MKASFPLTLAAAAAGIAIGAAGTWWWTRHEPGAHAPAPAAAVSAPVAASAAERKVLYWYDPMVPGQRFDKPGKSPFMDMQLVPRYADEEAGAGGVRIAPEATQNLGVRLATVETASLATQIEATGVVGFNERDVAIVQTRSAGFVQRVAPLAPGDVVAAGAPIAEVLVPDWAAAQQEFLALRRAGAAAEWVAAARERMRLAGMPEALVREVEASGEPRTQIAIQAPRDGVIQELGVREGMSLMPGQTLARINGIATVWLDVAVPEAQAGGVRLGQLARVQLPALPGETLQGRVTALLPMVNEAARALRVRVELPNRGGRLRPGLTAQVSLVAPGAGKVLTVPTEAVIRTGQRALVMLAEDGGRYRPVEVTLGTESGGRTQVVQGLAEGQRVVASGQFLIDSEASLKGITAAPPLHEADATVDAIEGGEVTLTHGPFRTLNMPGMTMPFPLADPKLAAGLKPGDHVRAAVRQTDKGLVVEKLTKAGAAK